jgi:hypothetical protein
MHTLKEWGKILKRKENLPTRILHPEKLFFEDKQEILPN